MSVVSSTLNGAALLAAYRPGTSSVFASPRGTLLAEGVRAEATTVAEAASLLRTQRFVVGAVPFDPSHPARLVAPERLHRADPITTTATVPTARRAVPPIPDDAYVNAVTRAVADIEAGTYTKVVLARALRLTVPGFDAAPVVRALARAGGYTFGVDLGAGRTLLGASPELLVARHGRTVVAHPLAGSVPRSTDPAEDARRATALLASAKDLHEHTFARAAVADGLRRFCSELRVPPEPALTATPTMWHLGSRITGEITDPSVSALTLAAALHPTPAVCGTPPEAARRAIAELEPFDRGFFAGMVGWSDADGDGEWAVTIRCATAGPDGLDVYAGAGIVAGSDPQAELAETTAKLGTMLTALGVTDVAR
ncbi:isochorismate synthase [Actinoplanes sp. NPDC023936]|uniref:isochorismate synthase n=1 Tax=Actinoplanes sp. NPDC023936 TaxID=3154910 RepID=UPI0033CB192E